MPKAKPLTPEEYAGKLESLKWYKYPVLDDGHVMLVDAMGGDADICQAARVSYGKGTKSVSEDAGLIRYLLRHRHCYDDQTEVLTPEGFIKWSELYDNSDGPQGSIKTSCLQLGCWDPNLKSLVFERPEYLTCDEYTGPMYRVDAQQVDLLVTPEHSMYTSVKRWSAKDDRMHWTEPTLLSADFLDDRSMVRYYKTAPLMIGNAFNPQNWSFPSDSGRSVLKFCGFFIGDGSVASANGVNFNIRKRRKIDYLTRLCDDLGWDCHQIKNDSWSVLAPGLGDACKIFYDNKDKSIPEWLLIQPDALAILDGLRHSDGATKRSTWTYHTTSPKLKDDFERVAVYAGLAVSTSIQSEGGPGNKFGGAAHKTCYRINILAKGHSPIINQGISARGHNQVSKQDYTGKVYCAKTRTGILVVKRNGKVVLSGNTTPFEMIEFKFRVRVPMDCWRQWIRHRTASTNEYSTRYSEAIDSRQRVECWRAQSGSNKQGSDGHLEGDLVDAWNAAELTSAIASGGSVRTVDQYLSEQEEKLHRHAEDVYKERIGFGVAREQARKDLPLSTYTEAFWKIDLHNLLHFLGLRLDSHAQKEIRSYATAISKIVRQLVPITWEAFEDYRLNSMQLTSIEIDIIKAIAMSNVRFPVSIYEFLSLQPLEWAQLSRCRERDECIDKFRHLNLLVDSQE